MCPEICSLVHVIILGGEYTLLIIISTVINIITVCFCFHCLLLNFKFKFYQNQKAQKQHWDGTFAN